MAKLDLNQNCQVKERKNRVPIKFQLLCNANNEILILIVFVVFNRNEEKKAANSTQFNVTIRKGNTDIVWRNLCLTR